MWLHLERYWHWPSGVFRQRAREVEARLPEWGGELYQTLRSDTGREAFEAWKAGGDGAARRFSILVEGDPVAGALASDPALRFDDAAEILLLLESLG